jgi:hypothetical protein
VKLRDGARVRVAGDEPPVSGNPGGRPSGPAPPG